MHWSSLLFSGIIASGINMHAIANTTTTLDENSYANYDDVRITHLKLDLEASFAKKQLQGTAELTLKWIDKKANTLVLDTRDLVIEDIAIVNKKGEWQNTRYQLGDRHAIKGQSLTIKNENQPQQVRITYHTIPNASGLQWLTPAQTLSGKHPYMFSQSQAIHARSWIPLQDTPAVRFTYEATIKVPPELRAVMSADNKPEQAKDGLYHFTMPQAIPAYLLAIAIGELDYQSIGPRSGIYAEPQRLAAAAKEFEDTEKMIQIAEKLYGKYRWDRYDLLVLPPSFPFGGMENPRLTFVTPTVIVGDKSLTALIAHELAHSWSGNLVTNKSWSDFWLNEGFTVYVENRIVELVYGEDLALMERQNGQHDVLQTLKETPTYLQALVPEKRGDDPDAVFSVIPYEKGAWFLRTLESRVGRNAFDPFLRGWFDEHAFQSVSTDDFVTYLKENLLKKYPDAMSENELKAWLYEPGIPPQAKAAKSPRLIIVAEKRTQWLKDSQTDIAAKNWVTAEWIAFLDGFTEVPDIKTMAQLDAQYHLTQSTNSEIMFYWYLLGIRAGYEPIRQPMEKFLTEVGRRKFVKPLFAELAKTEKNKAWATTLYKKIRPRYHPLTQSSVDALLFESEKN